jgi:uncharacterized membrane protein
MSTTSEHNLDPSVGEFIDGGQPMLPGSGLKWIGEAFRLFGKAPGIWILIALVFFALSIAMAFVPVLGNLASTLLMPVFIGGIMLGCRALDAGEDLRIGHLFEAFSVNTGQLVLVGLFMLIGYVLAIIGLVVIAIVMVGPDILSNLGDGDAMEAWFLERGLLKILLIAAIGLALCIPLAMAYWFAPLLVVLRNLEPLAAMRQSFSACIRNVVPFLLYGIALLVLAIVAVIPIGLGLLVLAPVVYASIYTSYKDIFFK